MHQFTLRDPAFLGSVVVTPPDIDLTDLELWLKSDVGVLKAGGTPAGDGEAVETWENQTGVVDASQTTGGFKPILHTSILNGYPVVQFDGTDDTMGIVSSGETSLQTFTFFAVVRFNDMTPPSGANNNVITKGTGIFSREYTLFASSSPGLERWTFDGNFPDQVQGQICAINTWYRLIAQNDVAGGDARLWTNGVYNHTGYALSTSLTAAAAYIGYLGSMEIAEMGLYSRALNSTQISELDDYLIYRYAL